MENKKYLPTAIAVYINYAMLGIATVIISQYNDYFQGAWHTDLKGISDVIAMVGIGRLLTILFAGPLSDKFGRKPIMLFGLAFNVVFFVGLTISTSVFMASIFALFFGFSQSFSDASCYPALTDAFKEKSATMSTLTKAAMSIAQFILPFAIAISPSAKFSLWIFAIIMIGTIVFVLFCKFAPQNTVAVRDKEETVIKTDEESSNKAKPIFAIDGIALILIGFTSVITFYLFMQYMPTFGENILSLSKQDAKSLLAWYAMASLVSVFVTSIVVNKVKPMIIVFLYSFISLLALLALVLFPSPGLAKVTGLIIGFFAAGGIWQLGLSVLTIYFPQRKGLVTSFYSFAAAFCYFIGPKIAGILIDPAVQNSILKVFWFDIIVTIIGVALAFVVMVRGRKFN